ncbi:DUF4199 domain-containing protein [Acidobacteria bacterium AB60]|nr:DUF4199 domain-containing protein [Acidobacteria bacterium AB60]
MKKTVLTFGVVGGLIASALMLSTLPLEHRISSERALILGYTTIVASFLMVYFGIRSYRNKVSGGRITFGRAFVVGLLISLITCVFYVATWEVMYFGFMPDFMTKYTAAQIAKVKASGASAAVIQEKTAALQRAAAAYNNPLVNMAQTFLEPFPVGLLIALLSAAALRKASAKGQGPRAEEGEGTREEGVQV